MWSQEFDTNTHENYQYHYKNADHPKHIDFTIDEVVYMSHDAGTAGTHWSLSIEKDIGNGRTRRYYGIGIHVRDWLRLILLTLRLQRQLIKKEWWRNENYAIITSCFSFI